MEHPIDIGKDIPWWRKTECPDCGESIWLCQTWQRPHASQEGKRGKRGNEGMRIECIICKFSVPIYANAEENSRDNREETSARIQAAVRRAHRTYRPTAVKRLQWLHNRREERRQRNQRNRP